MPWENHHRSQPIIRNKWVKCLYIQSHTKFPIFVGIRLLGSNIGGALFRGRVFFICLSQMHYNSKKLHACMPFPIWLRGSCSHQSSVQCSVASQCLWLPSGPLCIAKMMVKVINLLNLVIVVSESTQAGELGGPSYLINYCLPEHFAWIFFDRISWLCIYINYLWAITVTSISFVLVLDWIWIQCFPTRHRSSTPCGIVRETSSSRCLQQINISH